MRQRKSPLELEFAKLEKQEAAFWTKRYEKRESKWNQFLAEKVPEKLQRTLDAAFVKAFQLIFEKGTEIIEKTYKREEVEKTYQINAYADQIRQNRKSLRAFSKKAGNAGTLNLVVSGTAGLGMGLLGIGIPDIAFFTGVMLKAIYEIALNYGYDYEEETERQFILLLIQTAVAQGDAFAKLDKQVNLWIENDKQQTLYDTNRLIEAAAQGLAGELLYMKFLQGIPVVGAVGGAYDAICMKQIASYVELKYRRRFYTNKRTKK